MTSNNPLTNRRATTQTTNYYNPQFNTILNQPQARQLISSIQRQMPGMSPREIAHKLAQQRGLDINPLMSRFGLR